jgi:hypothetical protein
MPAPVTIPRGPPAHPGLDYGALRSDALQFIENIAHASWTDFNEHDPGVTTLEQLCYALTELAYRAGSPVSELLANTDGNIDTRRQALHVPRRILPSEPVTPNDYRKLLVDRVPGLGNAWVTPRRQPAPGDVGGLYDIALYAPAIDACGCECVEVIDPPRQQALGIFNRHRALCEDLHRVSVLRPLSATLHAVAVIDGSEPPERIVAELLYRAGSTLAPELRRRPLSALLAEGQTPSTIFDGPLLRNGFIDDAELRPKANRIRVADLVRVMAACPGVRSVNELTVRVGRTTFTASDAAGIPVPADAVLRLDTGPEGRTPPIRLMRSGSPCRVDPARVTQELNRLWRAHRQTHPLARDYQHAFGLPRGKYRDFAQYTSVQNQYPAVYALAGNLPNDTSSLRQAQSKQLQGYLLVFEQILADYFAQLAHARDLLSTDAGLDRSYFSQPLADIVPGAKELLIDPAGVERLRREHDPFTERRNRFLDLLLALYAEETSGNPSGHTAEASERPVTDTQLIQIKLGLLARIAGTTRSRGRGFDYLAAPSARNAAGLESKCRVELGMTAEPPAADGTDTPTSNGRLYIVEHVLLRTARRLRGSGPATGGFDYGFTLSAVVCVPTAHSGDAGFRRQVVGVVERNAPAHLAVVTRFLEPERMRDFETLHMAWRKALAARVPRHMVKRSVALRDFLAQCPPSADDASQGGHW